MNKLKKVFKEKKNNILNIYFTAGFPNLNDTTPIIQLLEKSGADIIELGIPYSDPLADGLTIQKSSEIALNNGISLDKVFTQLHEIKDVNNTPIVLMGYYNQFLQYGMDKLIAKMKECKIDGLIIPDLPMDHYISNYKDKFESSDISISFLITPETSESRIQLADNLSNGFLYIVAQSSITGGVKNISTTQKSYFERIHSMSLTSPKLIGFGIHDNETFKQACLYADGAIIGSAFIRNLEKNGLSDIENFIKDVIK